MFWQLFELSCVSCISPFLLFQAASYQFYIELSLSKYCQISVYSVLINNCQNLNAIIQNFLNRSRYSMMLIKVKVGSFQIRSCSTPFSQHKELTIFHAFVDFSGSILVNACKFCVISGFSFASMLGDPRNTVSFKYPQITKSKVVSSSERGGHEIVPAFTMQRLR